MDMDIEKSMADQIARANQIAKIKKSESYGKPFIYEFNGLQHKELTKYGLKTIKDLLNQLRTKYKIDNLQAFEDKNRTTLLGDSIKLKEQAEIFIFSIQQNKMVYIHVFGKKEQMSYYVNLDMTLQEFINNYNSEFQDDKIDINQDQYILSHYLHPGGYIRTQMINNPLSVFLKEGEEGLFRLEKQ